MLDMGFMPDVERIVNLVSKRRQTLMFSATMPGEIRRLASAFLTDPQGGPGDPAGDHGRAHRGPFRDRAAAPEVQGAETADRGPRRRQRADLLQPQARGREPAPADGAGRPQRARHPWRSRPVAAHRGARCVQAGRDRLPGRDRRRGARARHRDAALRDQLRRPDPRRRLRPSDRSHRPRRPGGPGVHAGAAGRAALRRCDHAADRQGRSRASRSPAWSRTRAALRPRVRGRARTGRPRRPRAIRRRPPAAASPAPPAAAAEAGRARRSPAERSRSRRRRRPGAGAQARAQGAAGRPRAGPSAARDPRPPGARGAARPRRRSGAARRAAARTPATGRWSAWAITCRLFMRRPVPQIAALPEAAED